MNIVGYFWADCKWYCCHPLHLALWWPQKGLRGRQRVTILVWECHLQILFAFYWPELSIQTTLDTRNLGTSTPCPRLAATSQQLYTVERDHKSVVVLLLSSATARL